MDGVGDVWKAPRSLKSPLVPYTRDLESLLNESCPTQVGWRFNWTVNAQTEVAGPGVLRARYARVLIDNIGRVSGGPAGVFAECHCVKNIEGIECSGRLW